MSYSLTKYREAALLYMPGLTGWTQLSVLTGGELIPPDTIGSDKFNQSLTDLSP